jgi:hypothetical protein
MRIGAVYQRVRLSTLARQRIPDDATTDRDLRVPPSNHFEKLRGKLAECIRVNSQWRFGPTAGRCPGRPRASILTTIGTDEANWGIGMRRRSVPCPYQLGS